MASEMTQKKPTGLQWVVVGVVFVYLGLILFAPLVAVGVQALKGGIDPLIETMRDKGALHALYYSLILAAIALVANGVVGVATAIVLTRHRFWGRKILDGVVDLPLAVSPVMVGLAFLLVFGRNGWLEAPLQALNWKVTFAFPGLVIGTLFVTFPFTLREVGYVLEELGTFEEEAAATLGANPWSTFWLVTLPNIRYGLGYGIILTVARALGEFGAVLVLGGAISGLTETSTTYIYNAFEERQEAAAYTMSLLLAATSVGLLMVLEWMKHQRAKEL